MPRITAIKLKLIPIFQLIGFAQTGVEHGGQKITDAWLARLKDHADEAQRILEEVRDA